LDSKKLQHFLKEMGRAIDRFAKGDFGTAPKLLQSPKKFGEFADHAEALALLGVSLETREYPLNEKIKELKKARSRLAAENRPLKHQLRSSQGVAPLHDSFSLRDMI
jgi:hypothetical protein